MNDQKREPAMTALERHLIDLCEDAALKLKEMAGAAFAAGQGIHANYGDEAAEPLFHFSNSLRLEVEEIRRKMAEEPAAKAEGQP